MLLVKVANLRHEWYFIVKFKEVVVVEGMHDVEKIKRIYPDIDILITNGSEIERHLPPIVEIAKTRKIILFLDPDYPGERIRKRITEVVPNAKHAFLNKSKAISKNKKKIGVEHASSEDIIKALENALTPTNNKNGLTMVDLIEFGYIGKPNSASKRQNICDKLNMGHANGKTFLKRLNLFGITKEKL